MVGEGESCCDGGVLFVIGSCCCCGKFACGFARSGIVSCAVSGSSAV